jgi:hypothetical protein
VAEILQPLGRKEIIIDLTRLGLLAEPARATVAGYAHGIRAKRGGYVSDVVTLRSGDLEPMSYELGIRPTTLLRSWTPPCVPRHAGKTPRAD